MSGASVFELPPPVACGLPAERFERWRPNQPQAAMRAIEAPVRFPVLVAPTGFGKSAVAEVIARYMGRSMYLTVTKALADQINREFVDRFDIRGRANYDCEVLLNADLTGWQAKCDQAEGLCDACHLKERGCSYYDAMREAKRRLHDVSNYAKWLTTGDDDMGEFDVLICDEAHDAVEQLSASLRVELGPRVVEEFCHEQMPSERPIVEWSSWASRHLVKLRPLLDAIAIRVAYGDGGSNRRRLRDLRGLVRTLEVLAVAGADWIEDRPEGSSEKVAFEPVWPRRYGGKLWRGVPKIVLMSATVTRKDLALLGIDSAEVDFAEYPSSFPVANRPVVAVPNVRMSAGMSDQERIDSVRRIDQVIDGRMDRKGIVHTVSFERARFLLQHSRHSSMMLFNDPARRYGRTQSEHTADTVAEFRRRETTCVLVGPSFDTGWDFPGVQAEYQVIWKIPFLNRHASKVANERCKQDDSFDGWQAMKTIVQMAGRIVRSETDRGETLILDDMWSDWFLRVNRRHAPNWFLAAVRGPEPIPRPLAKL